MCFSVEEHNLTLCIQVCTLDEQTERQWPHHHGSTCSATALTPAAAVARQNVQEIPHRKIEPKKKKKAKWKKEVHAGSAAAHTLRTGRVGFRFPRDPRVQPLV